MGLVSLDHGGWDQDGKQEERQLLVGLRKDFSDFSSVRRLFTDLGLVIWGAVENAVATWVVGIHGVLTLLMDILKGARVFQCLPLGGNDYVEGMQNNFFEDRDDLQLFFYCYCSGN